ncbi:hypothetical protein SAMN05216578_103390 [Halopseudomonas formosensis]|uniref:Toxin VasX N-terminal region domain-containing protein n=1 Tax=Halopseudomonas formosensis TaxID=1002526 RepID=A0A1I6BCG2_9GAMM|nr:T6SS effector BTH_I2691 family protein [Halopseudomonas formosensis]SFQ78569.1 hypothetical protein SAMN05216578_103390 [Halopseudomonas formosensis]
MTVVHPLSLAQAQRNQQFEDKPASANAQCPLRAQEVAIFPVRYALDESPAKGSSQGPNPLPTGFDAGHLPPLESRSYTLRQLRDGWLYVWDEVARTFHEYRVQGHLFTRMVWTERELGQDARDNAGDTRPYLLYPRSSRLRLAYSPVQWTWRICERMRSNVQQQTQWMRDLDLGSYCNGLQIAHGAPLRTLGDCVADISSAGAVPGFETTFVPTTGEPNSEHPAMQVKPGISDAQVLGAVPDQDTALFIALDDPLAVIQDLNMQLNGRLAEIGEFDIQYRNTIQSALAVHQACGVDLDAVMPTAVRDDLQQRLAFTADAHRFLTSYAYAHGGAHAELGAVAGALHAHQIDVDIMRDKWQVSHNHPAWHELAKDWRAKDTWRNDVRYDEVCIFLNERADELLRLRRHVRVSETDLIRWLESLRPEVEALFYDTCNAQQSAELLEWVEGIAQSLGGCSSDEVDAPAQNNSIMRLARLQFQGQSWLYRQMTEESNLIGLALFNFNSELAQALEQIAYNYTTTGTIDGLGQQPDTSGQINTGSDFWQRTLKGAEDVQDLLSLEMVRNSRLYRSLSETARMSMDALRQATLQRAGEVWNRLSTLFLPALKAQANNPTTAVHVLRLSLIQIVVSHEVSDIVALKLNRNFAREQQQWTMEQQTIARQRRGQQGTLSRSGNWYDKKSARQDLRALDVALQDHYSNCPRHVYGVLKGQSRSTTVSVQQLEVLLFTVGQSEAQTQLHLKATSPAAYAARTKAWVDLNLGGTLPVLLAGLGLWNLMVTTRAVHHDGYLTGEEKNQLLTSLATAGSLLMALMVMPMWARVGNMVGVIRGQTLELTQAGARVWLKESQFAHAKLAQRLIARTAGMAALNVIAAASEIVQVGRQMERATSQEQTEALNLQLGSLYAMGFLGSIQTLGSLSGLYFNFAWVMGGWMIGLLAIVGLVYLVASVLVSLYHREGLRLWLYQCYWGKAAIPMDNTDEAHGQSLWQLAQICLTPGVSVRSTNNPYWNGLDGAWLQISLPAQLAGQGCEVKAVFVRKAGGFLASRSVIALEQQVYDRLSGGYWSPALEDDPLSNMPPVGHNDKLPSDHDYSAEASHYHWRTWIPVSGASYVELELSYPELDKEREPMRFMFRAKLMNAPRAAELISDPLSDGPVEGELLSRTAVQPQMITLPAPFMETSDVLTQTPDPAAPAGLAVQG